MSFSVSNYTFDNLSRLGDDSYDISERNLQNNHFNTHMTSNYYPSGMAKPVSFALNQPNVFYNGGFIGGSNIDADSNLRIGSIQTAPTAKLNLQQRPFATVPYVGRGAPKPVIEARIQQGDYVRNRKSCGTISDTAIHNRHYTPLVPSLQATISNAANLVEEAAHSDWIRGGIPTRSIIKDQDYKEKHMPGRF
jgi:hypothetical protein